MSPRLFIFHYFLSWHILFVCCLFSTRPSQSREEIENAIPLNHEVTCLTSYSKTWYFLKLYNCVFFFSLVSPTVSEIKSCWFCQTQLYWVSKSKSRSVTFLSPCHPNYTATYLVWCPTWYWWTGFNTTDICTRFRLVKQVSELAYFIEIYNCVSFVLPMCVQLSADLITPSTFSSQ